MIAVQALMSLAMLLVQNAAEFRIIFRKWKPSLFVGATIVVGSAGWFTAFTLERAAYVKTLGQIEFILTLAISTFYFKERPNKLELSGMAVLVSGVVLLLLAP
jgi:drug/metabolite transporter (DMT)-like permease